MKLKNVLPISLLLIFSIAVAIAKPLDIPNEISQASIRAEQMMAAQTQPISLSGTNSSYSDIQDIRVLRTYINLLKIIQKQANPVLTTETKAWFLNGITHLRLRLKAEVTADSVFELFEYIEGNRTHSTSSQTIAPFVIRDSIGKDHPVEFDRDEDGNIYLQFENSFRGSGANKTATSVVDLNWFPLVRLDPNPNSDDDHLKIFEEEKKFLTRLSALPKAEQVGLVEVRHVGKSIYERDYPYRLQEILDRTVDIQLSKADLRNIELQLTRGLKQLHKMGISMSDVKPENIYLSLPINAEDRLEAVLADFDLSFEPILLLKSTTLEERPNAGTMEFSAPELTQTFDGEELGWYGKTNTERAENALKADVFSLATVLYLIGHFKPAAGTNVTPWKICDPKRGYESYIQCISRKLYELLRIIGNQKVDGTADPLDGILFEALEPNPIDRITSEIFLKKLIALPPVFP